MTETNKTDINISLQKLLRFALGEIIDTLDKSIGNNTLVQGDLVGNIYSNGGKLILKNGEDGNDAQFKGIFQGGLSGLVYSYNNNDVNNIQETIDNLNKSSDNKARLVMDPGSLLDENSKAKFYGNIIKATYDSNGNVEKEEKILNTESRQLNANAATATFADEDSPDDQDKQTINNRLKKLEEKINKETIGVPIGTIVMWSGSPNEIPNGWRLCDGDNTDQERIGLEIPNLSGQFVVGYNPNDNDFDKIGSIGGEKSVTLNIDEIPNHSHEISSIKSKYSSASQTESLELLESGSKSFLTSTTGGGKSHNNLPPYMVLAYIIYVGS